jgi:hypothetical protein|tara:strand:- start:3103 stop:3294 length:192 start_codon:yes stop_codon:yes gene_type:complete
MKIGDLVAYPGTVWHPRGVGIIIYKDDKRNVFHIKPSNPGDLSEWHSTVITYEGNLELLSENR